MSNKQITESDERFKDTVAGSFYGMLRAAGITMTPGGQLERIREIAASMADAIEFQAEKKSVLVIRKLQTAVKAAFQSIEEDMEALKRENMELKERLNNLEEFAQRTDATF